MLISYLQRINLLNTPGFGKADLRGFYAEKFRLVMVHVSHRYPVPTTKYHGWGLTTDGIKTTKKCWTRTYGLCGFSFDFSWEKTCVMRNLKSSDSISVCRNCDMVTSSNLGLNLRFTKKLPFQNDCISSTGAMKIRPLHSLYS